MRTTVGRGADDESWRAGPGCAGLRSLGGNTVGARNVTIECWEQR